MADAPTTKRAQARVAMTADIKRVAREQLAEHGPDGLSLRAVARELGVVSSAVYRYVASRDELLTLLIIDAYDAVGDAAERAASEGGTFEDRWAAVCRAVRGWAIANPNDYALVYGSPVPGYAAPTDTIDPALRVTRAVVAVADDGWRAGEIVRGAPVRLPRIVRSDLTEMRRGLGVELPDEVMARALLAWTGLFGHLSWELFGHLKGGVTDYDALFAVQVRAWARVVVDGA